MRSPRTYAVGLLGLALAGLVALPPASSQAATADAAAAPTAAAARLAANPDLQIPGFDQDAFAHPTTQKPAVLWFWNRVQTEAQVDETLQDMHDAGFTETVIFRMDGEQFFSDAWFERVEDVLEKSQELGMTVWLDNDSQFPSGAAGGLIVNGGTVGDKTYEPRPDLGVKTAYRAGDSVVRGGGDVDLTGLFGSSIALQDGEVVADAGIFPGITLLKDGAGWADYETTAHFTIEQGTAGFMVRSPDKRNGILVDVRKAGNVDFWRQVDGNFTQLRLGADLRPGWDPAAKHTISIRTVGPQIAVTLDGVDEPVISDPTFATGRVGMRVDGAQKWRLDDLAVTEVPGGASLYDNDFSDAAAVNDFDVAVTPLENVIAVTARPATGDGADDLDQVVDLTADYAADGTWDAPAGDWRIEAFAYRFLGDNYADTLDPEAMALYDDIIMGEYYDRFAWAFGTVLQGFADDEPSLSNRPNENAVPWSPTLRDRLESGGTNVADAMVSIFDDLGRAGAAVKSHFYRDASDQWVDSYWKPKYEWTEAHGVSIISNPLWDEHGPSEELRHSGNLLTAHQWSQVPGTDLISNDVGSGAARFLPRTAASVAHQLGKPLVYDELMGATGWERTLDDLREGAAISALRGINKALYHTTYDAIEGIPYPPVFMKENTWWPWMNDVNEWTGRLMEFGRHTTAAPTALLQTQRSNEATQRSADGPVADRDWIATMNSLEDSQVDFDQLDEGALTDDPAIIAQAEVVDGALRVGEMTYTTVVVPRAPYLSLEAAETLRDFVAAGGELLWAGAPPTHEIDGRDDALADAVAAIESAGGDRVVEAAGPAGAGAAAAALGQSAVTLSKPNAGVRALRFDEGATDGYLLLNEGGAPVTVDVTFPSEGVPATWDPETGEVVAATTYRSTDAGTVVPMTLDPRAPLGVTVTESDAAGGATAHVTKVIGDGEVLSGEVVDGAFTAQVRTSEPGVTVLRGTDGAGGLLTGSTAPATLPDAVHLDGDWTMALENGAAPVTRPLQGWTDLAPTYSGSATYSTTLTLDAADLDGTDWSLDLGQVADVAEISVNGTEVGTRIWAPYVLESDAIAAALHPGENTVSVRVTNTQANEKTGNPVTSGLLGPVTLVPSVTQPVTLGTTAVTATEASATMDEDDRGADVTLTVSNTGDAPVTGRVTASGPDGWTTKRSEPITVPAGGTATGTARLFPGGFVDDRAIDVRAGFEVDGVVVDDAATTVDATFPTPPPASLGVTDHVDLGDAASEAAHGLTASPTSGTNTEAGLTRRYGGYRIPDAYYEFDLAVTPGQGFVLQGLETYDANPQQKSYRVFVDGELVATRLNVRPLRQEGTAAYRLHVPARFVGSEGTVRVRLQSRSDPDFADPSLADVWALPFQGDVAAPDVTATTSAAVPGESGWSRSTVQVSLAATDDRDETPAIEYGLDSGWLPYTGPVTVDAEGVTTLSYRARDTAGNRTEARSVDVRIDRVAPTTSVEARVRPGVDASDEAVLRFSASDATSGVASTTYRVDGGDWLPADDEPVTVSGYGRHEVEYASTDVAGNAEPTGSLALDLRDVDAVAALVAPQISGTAKAGRTLRATTGTWNTQGLGFDYRWFRGRTPIPGATDASYVLRGGDVGHRVSVRVTASKPGLDPASATSSPTARVAKAVSRSTLRLGKGSVKRGRQVKVTATVTSSPQASGKVAVLVDGRVLKKVRLSGGRVVTNLRISARGKHTVSVRYLGSGSVAPSTSKGTTVRVT